MTKDTSDLHEDEIDDAVSGDEDLNDDADNIDDTDADDADADGDDGQNDTVAAGDKGGEGDAKGGEPTRGGKRIQALAQKNRDLEARAIRAETLAAERERNAQPRNQSPDDARRARDEKLALMDPTERATFENNEKLEHMQGEIMRTRVQTQDILDKNSYAAEAKGNPVYAKHKDEVEKRYIDGCKAGVWFPREKYLAVVIGEAALKAKPDNKKKEEARQRVDSSKGTPPAGRSNASSNRSSRGEKTFEELEKSLEGVTF